MSIELVTKYQPYVDEMFKNESKLPLLTNNDFNFTGAHTVKAYKISTASMGDYDRNAEGTTISRFGEIQKLDATTEEMMLKKDRSFTFAIDHLDNDETANQLNGATALARQQREVIIPEIDTYVYGVMVSGAGTVPTAVTLTKENIFEEIAKASETLDDSEIPETQRILVVCPEVYRLMKQSNDIILNTDIGEDMRLKGVIAMVDGMKVVKVPKIRLPKNFGFMVAHPSATIAPVKLSEYDTFDNPPFISGTLVQGRVVYDAFVFDNKKKGIYYQENKASV